MPVLPLVDLLILVAWTSLIWAALHKALWAALAMNFRVLGMGPFDFVVIAGVSLLFALALAARVWVKANEPRLLAQQSRRRDPDYDFDPEAAGAESAPRDGAAAL